MLTPVIRMLTGEWAGHECYVTWNDGSYLRVTPKLADPLTSYEFKIGEEDYEELQPEE